MVDILVKSWEKMSTTAREAALQLQFGSAELALVKRALEKAPPPG
jgi:hypothetical protein